MRAQLRHRYSVSHKLAFPDGCKTIQNTNPCLKGKMILA